MTKNTDQHLTADLSTLGFDADSSERCRLLLDGGDRHAALRLLLCGRCRLIESVHSEQKKLDAVDYLIYQLRKEEQTHG